MNLPFIRSRANTFPHFKSLSREDYFVYARFIRSFPQHCDFTLNNLAVWLDAHDTLEYSWLYGNIVLRISGSPLFEDPGPTYTILGNKQAHKSLTRIFDSSDIRSLHLVPDYFVDSLSDRQKTAFVINDDRDNWDYVINIDDLIKKSGSKYENFRYQIKYFLKNYSDNAVIKPIDLQTTEGVHAIVNALHSWPVINSFTQNGNDPHRTDAQAIARVLEIQQWLPIKHQALGIYIEDKLQGFSIFHIPPATDNIAMGNHIKFNGEYKRLFDILAYTTATTLKSQGVALLNAEQDMGIEGIRHHKLDLNPMAFYKKYTITPLN